MSLQNDHGSAEALIESLAVLTDPLQRNRSQGGDGVHEPADGTAFLGHLDKDFAGLTVGIESHGDVPFVTSDLEFMGQRLPGIRHIDGFGDRAGEKRLGGSHHPQVSLGGEATRAQMRLEGTVEDREMHGFQAAAMMGAQSA